MSSPCIEFQEFSGGLDVSMWGGLAVFKKYWGLLNVPDCISESGFVKRHGYPLDGLFFSLACKPLAKIPSVNRLGKDLEKDNLLLELSGFNSKADQSTLSRTFNFSVKGKTEEFSDNVVSKMSGRGFVKNKVLIVDSTFLHVHRKGYENAGRGYDGSTGKTALGYMEVVLLDADTRMPVAFDHYNGSEYEGHKLLPLLDRAGEFIDEKTMILFDRGYYSVYNLKEVANRGLLFVTPSKTKVKFIEDWFVDMHEILPAMEFKENTERDSSIADKVTFLPEFGQIRLVCEQTSEGVISLLTNDFKSKPWEILELYGKRWRIEEFFKETRSLGLNTLPTGKFEGIRLHVTLTFMAYIILNIIRRLSGLVKKSIETIRYLTIEVTAIIKKTKNRITIQTLTPILQTKPG